MSTNYQKATTDALVQMFRAVASGRGAALEKADPKTANRLYRQMAKLYAEIKHRGTQAQRQILPLLDDEDASVRASAATYALEFDARAAEPVLEKIDREERNLCGLTAQMVLKQWKAGKLRFPQ